MGAAVPCVKYLLFTFNFLFFLMGCGIFGIGIWMKTEYAGSEADYAGITKYGQYVENIIIAVGVIILIVAFFGCFGAIKEIGPMLLAFCVLIFIIFIIELVAGGVAYVKRGDLEDELAKEMNHTIQNKYFKSDQSDVTKAVDKFQRKFDCCGFNDFKDWKYSYYHSQKKGIPKSCCKVESTLQCGTPNPSAIDVYYTKGCYKEVKDFIKDNLLYIGGVAIGFAVSQILGMVFSMYLYCAIRDVRGTLL